MFAVEDVYPLAPMQEGMLFHSLYAPHAGVGVGQTVCTWNTAVNVDAFQRAWQRVMDRHPVLRTSFHWPDRGTPVQVVHRRSRFAVEYEDLRALPETEQERRFQDYLQADRHRPVNLDKVPLTWLKLFRFGETEHRFAWHWHHIFLDGYAYILMLNESFTFYEAFCRDGDVELKLPRPFRDYVTWLQEHDWGPAERYWRETLAAFTAPTPLLRDRAPGEIVKGQDGYDEQEAIVSASVNTALLVIGKEHGLTLNTFVQGAWGFLLSYYSGQDDVVFGATRACRAGSLPEAKSIVGVFSNVVPMRVRLAADLPLLTWLEELRALQVAIRPYESVPLGTIQRLSEVPSGVPLFETLLTFGNEAEEDLLAQMLPGRTFRRLSQTNFAITLKAYGGNVISLGLAYYRHRFAPETIARMLRDLSAVLELMASHPEQHLGDLRRQLEAASGRASVAVREQAAGPSRTAEEAPLRSPPQLRRRPALAPSRVEATS